METTSLERRKTPRFHSRLHVKLEKGKGVTRDFSTSGVYFETDRSLSPADQIEFFLNLEYSDLGPHVRVHCFGEVVRVEPMVEKTGVAVAIHKFWFEVPGQQEQG